MDLKVVLYLPMLVSASGFVEIENAVPRDPVNGFYGEAAILPCTFPLESFRDLSGTTITWQRELAVVHSFYYSQDQLDRQNVQYVNRTTLFIHEIERGNASLRLNSLTLQDSGEYTCYISTHSGSKKKSVLLSVTALYSEPRLQFFMLKTEVSVLVTSEGGFPFPTVQWLIENSEVTMWNETEMRQDTNTGMIFVSSRINLTDLTNSSLTFVLHNHHTGQHIRREIQLYSGKY
ncbi:hypothetical protein DNTS_032862 [Danionella cerebrum]|uniref:Ig-like domain-containing protein n=1 Tax=Danionella cerebrum TaxID=2873325 RepID=A0A553QTS2_9TELE|nr:hypothetical protein DNTS_032862 [Danionella translucida]